ncbi:MAG: type III-A CRISPR-associated protein Csm2 [Bacteroidales bacterium]|nr:type III-A CRISPR-associated protein Csm2 [Bacteroidales bacterium]MCF8387703.1 type III-A CRISPR-associated protein Csm2 [Bacteroidales bacterium]MCF8398513.1 type III-A CRISPR-associated protein Csm2 [Bacteroidales bacterium]
MTNGNIKFQKGRKHGPPENWAAKFDTSWITDKITKDTVKFCDEFGGHLKRQYLTTSQIRNVYGELKRIQMRGFENEKTSFILLKPKMAYSVARDRKLEDLKRVFDKAYDSVEKAEHFENLMDFMEALLAFHKSHGGK